LSLRPAVVPRHPVRYAESPGALARRGAVLQPECDELHAVPGIDNPPGADGRHVSVRRRRAGPVGLGDRAGGPVVNGSRLVRVADRELGPGVGGWVGQEHRYCGLASGRDLDLVATLQGEGRARARQHADAQEYGEPPRRCLRHRAPPLRCVRQRGDRGDRVDLVCRDPFTSVFPTRRNSLGCHSNVVKRSATPIPRIRVGSASLHRFRYGQEHWRLNRWIRELDPVMPRRRDQASRPVMPVDTGYFELSLRLASWAGDRSELVAGLALRVQTSALGVLSLTWERWTCRWAR